MNNTDNMFYLLEIDETARHGGKRALKVFPFTDDGKDAIVNAYHEQWRGMVNICVCQDDGEGKTLWQKLLVDEDGRKYIKGSPFYDFPTVPRIPKKDLPKFKEN